MDFFSYVMVLASIIIGLALTHLLQGVARIVQHPKLYPVYWVHLVWVGIMFVTAILWWWFEFLFSKTRVWTFELYVFVLCCAVLIYVTAAVVLPSNLHGYHGFKDYYYSRRGWIYGLNLAFYAFDVVDTLAKGTAHFASLGWQYPVAVVSQSLLSIAAIICRNEKLHAAVAVILLVYRTGSALLIFHTVQ